MVKLLTVPVLPIGVCSDSEWHIYTFLLTLNAIITCWSSFVALRKIVG